MVNGRAVTGATGYRQHAVAIAAGFAISVAVSAVSGRREAWDSSLYFVAGIPLMCLVVGWLAYHYPDRAWRWTLSMAVGQSLAMALGQSSLSLWPLALVATVIVSIPQFLTGLIASRAAIRAAAGESRE
jgi:biotin transporter BioY